MGFCGCDSQEEKGGRGIKLKRTEKRRRELFRKERKALKMGREERNGVVANVYKKDSRESKDWLQNKKDFWIVELRKISGKNDMGPNKRSGSVLAFWGL